ncbi:MAG: alpha/beta hydrolase [Rhodospirillales bacterium]|nr:alpha/beta hydrolase [Rhodospirillales bacterium]
MSAIYRTFDQATLDQQYNAQATVGDIMPFVDMYAAGSEAARVRLPFEEALSFGASPEETLDLFPAGDGAPLLVFIHGGYWRALSKNESSFMAPCMARHGIATAAVNYTLRPHATLDEIVAEVRRALTWLYHHSATFGCDPERILVAGSSAGGHLAGMLVSRGWHEDFGVPETIVKGGVLLSGLYDLDPVQRCYANDWVGLDETSARRNSPLIHLPAEGCPLVLSYGGSETDEFKRQSDDYAAAWRSAGFEADCFEISQRNHFDIPLELADPTSLLTRKILELIATV